MRTPLAIALIAFATAALGAATGGMYKWIDEKGRVQYSDLPPPPGTKVLEERRLTKGGTPSAELPYSVQQAAKSYPVTLWSSPDCGPICNDARALLSKRGVPFSERNPQKPEEAEVLKKLTGGESVVPVLQVGELKSVKGYLESEWQSALDAAGYPKNAPPLKPAPTDK
jgi:glutaredoxin